MKVLIDNTTNKIIGSYAFPLNFSLSGKTVVDLPDTFGIEPTSSTVATLLTRKVAAFQALHPTITEVFSDELFDLTNVDTALSSRIIAAPGKRTMILPGGYLMTQQIVINDPALTKVCLHWSGFTTYLESGPSSVPKPKPSRLLHDYDTGLSDFTPFDPTIFQASMMDNTGGVALIGTLTLDTETTYLSGTPLTVRLKFLNADTKPAYLSDWIFLT